MPDTRNISASDSAGAELVQSQGHVISDEEMKELLSEELDWLIFGASDDEFDADMLNGVLNALDKLDPLPEDEPLDTEAGLRCLHERLAAQRSGEYAPVADNNSNSQSSNYLGAYGVGATAKSGGIVSVTVDVTAVVNATEIGAKNIYIYKGSSPTGIFTCVAQYSSDNYPTMLGSGYYYYRTPIDYPGTVGKYYFANVQIYAADSTGSDSRMEPTNTVCAHN